MQGAPLPASGGEHRRAGIRPGSPEGGRCNDTQVTTISAHATRPAVPRRFSAGPLPQNRSSTTLQGPPHLASSLHVSRPEPSGAHVTPLKKLECGAASSALQHGRGREYQALGRAQLSSGRMDCAALAAQLGTRTVGWGAVLGLEDRGVCRKLQRIHCYGVESCDSATGCAVMGPRCVQTRMAGAAMPGMARHRAIAVQLMRPALQTFHKHSDAWVQAQGMIFMRNGTGLVRCWPATRAGRRESRHPCALPEAGILGVPRVLGGFWIRSPVTQPITRLHDAPAHKPAPAATCWYHDVSVVTTAGT